MKILSFAIIFLVLSISGCSVKKVQKSSAQEPVPDPEQIMVVVEDLPTFQGGDIKTFEAWVQERVQYPDYAAENDIEGDVFIMFMVEPDGSLSNVTVLRGVHPSLDHEAMRVVKSSPAWEYQSWKEGQAKARFSITVKFKKE